MQFTIACTMYTHTVYTVFNTMNMCICTCNDSQCIVFSSILRAIIVQPGQV